jgi:hypothetical protein
VRWATRPGCHVDRTACAWALRRFIDPHAEFVFTADLDAARALGATPFDMRGAESWATTTAGAHSRVSCRI